MRDERVEKMTDEDVETYYSCTLCQSFAPSHVCVGQPGADRPVRRLQLDGLQGLFEINPTGPNQPIEKGECLDPVLGQWKGVNDFVYKASRGAVTHYNFYSMVTEPMTTCGCCECIAAMLPSCNGVMTVQPRLRRGNPLRHEVHHPGRRHGRRGLFAGFRGPLQVQHHPA
jgi:acetyl-CoA synthase